MNLYNINIIYWGIKQINIELSLKNANNANIGGKEENIIFISDYGKKEDEIFNKITNAKIFEVLFLNDKLLICGNNPSIYDIHEKKIFHFINNL